MCSKPLVCRPRCCRGRFEKSWVGMGGQRGSFHSIGVGVLIGGGASPSGKRVRDQSSNRHSSGPERPDAVRRGAAVGRQEKIVGKTVVHRGRVALRVHLVELPDVHVLALWACTTASLSLRRHSMVAAAMSEGKAFDQGFRRRDILAVRHPGHALIQHPHEVDVHLDELTRVHLGRHGPAWAASRSATSAIPRAASRGRQTPTGSGGPVKSCGCVAMTW